MSVSDAQYQGWADDLADLDQQIEDLQKAKKDFYATVRDEHGKKTADALKSAIKIARMDSEKRSAAEEVEAEAFRILQIIQGPRAPRATRARENIEEFHAETGEIIESQPTKAAGQDGRNVEATGGAAFVLTHLPETANTYEPAAAVETAGDFLREPVATVQGQNIREGDAPRETDRQEDNDDSQNDGDASRPDAEFAGSSNGRTAEFDSADAGSTPAPASIVYPATGVVVMETCPPEGALAHPYAACWPVRDIDVSEGVREPIVKIGKRILDGRGRMFAARGWNGGKGMAYPVVQYDGTDPLMDCIRWNLASRPNLHPHNLKIIAQKLVKEAPERADEIHAAMGLVDEVAA